VAVAKMKKVAILVARSSAENVVEELQDHGIFEIRENSLLKEKSSFSSFSHVESHIADLDFVIRYLSPFAKRPESFRERILGGKVEERVSSVERIGTKDFSQIIQKCSLLEENEGKIDSQLSKIEASLSMLSYWKSLDIPLKALQSTESSFITIGSVEEREYEECKQGISCISNTFLKEVTRSNRFVSFLLVSHESSRTQVEHLLESYHFLSVDFGEALGTVSEEIAELSEKKVAFLTQKQEIEQQKRELAEGLRRVKMAHDALLWKKQQKDFFQIASETASTVYVEGWIPSSCQEECRKRLLKRTPYVEIIEIETSKDESPPVMLKNNSFIQPFENVTNLFGSPKYSELDPTAFLAPFFVIYFGFCLTDVGYGMLLFFATLAALTFMPLEKGTRSMVKLFFFGSLSTIIMGVLFGGYLGMTPDQLPFLKNAETGEFIGQVFNPVTELTDKVMPLAYGLGILQLWLAVVLGGINKWKQGKKREALFGSTSLGSIVILSLLYGAFPESSWILSLLSLLGVLLIFGFAPSSGNIFIRFLLGILGVVNELVSWLSNVLSYSRLFALGLATGVIALAFNSIATTISGILPGVLGVPIMLLILLFGHTLNVGLNLLGAFIHSARLQFVEFFGGFFEGGGKTFTPLKRKSKYLFLS
jgi:V/A-type H+-transporting ATPase subunit I